MTADLNPTNAHLRAKINQLVENHPELEVIIRDIASKQPANATAEQMRANLQERARAIIEAHPDLEHGFE